MDTKDTRSVEHIHTMKVGNKIVFFRAEVDAVDENGAAIEIKASNPRSKVGIVSVPLDEHTRVYVKRH